MKVDYNNTVIDTSMMYKVILQDMRQSIKQYLNHKEKKKLITQDFLDSKESSIKKIYIAHYTYFNYSDSTIVQYYKHEFSVIVTCNNIKYNRHVFIM